MLSLAAASSAQADQPSAQAVAEARRNEAKIKFEEGVAAFGERRYADAVTAFQRADAIAPSAPLSFNIARAFEHLDNPAAALRWYRDYLRRSPQAPNGPEVQVRVSELAGKLAERGVQQISVLSTPDGAAVLIDNQAVGKTPLTIELPPGAHRLQLRLQGYRDYQAEIVLDARTPQDVASNLEPLAPQPEPATVSAAPQARERPVAPVRPFGVAPWVVVGAGGATMIAALSFELARRSAESAAERASQLEYEPHYNAMHSRQTTARVLVGVGGALLVTGGVLLLLNEPRPPAPALALGCGQEGCAVAARGTF